MNPIRRRPCADPGQKQVPGKWITQKGIDSSRPVTEALPEAKSLRRDDGPGQAVTRVVDASNDVITLSADWPTCSSHEPHQATALRRSRTEASARQVDYAKRDSLCA